jgi:hypothetical protein
MREKPLKRTDKTETINNPKWLNLDQGNRRSGNRNSHMGSAAQLFPCSFALAIFAIGKNGCLS